MALLTPLPFFEGLVSLYQLHILIGLAAVLSHAGMAYRRNVPLSGWFLTGLFIVSAGAINDILFAHRIIQTAYLASFAFMGFVLIQSGIISKKFAQAAAERDQLNQRMLKQTALLAHESEARTEAEHNLRVEAESKVVLFGNAVHHLNNPINHIAGSLDQISFNQKKVTSTLDQIFDDTEDNPQAALLAEFFNEQFSETQSAIQMSSDALSRAAETVHLLRVVSGVDGTSFDLTTLADILIRLHKRIAPFLQSVDSKSLEQHAQCSCVGHPALYAQALELIISNLSTKESTHTKLVFQEADEEDYHRIIITPASMPSATELDRLCDLISHLLNPYQCKLFQKETNLILQLLSESATSASLASADATHILRT